jgi:hypothetical protein
VVGRLLMIEVTVICNGRTDRAEVGSCVWAVWCTAPSTTGSEADHERTTDSRHTRRRRARRDWPGHAAWTALDDSGASSSNFGDHSAELAAAASALPAAPRMVEWVLMVECLA